MSNVTVAENLGLHVNTISKYSKALAAIGQWPASTEAQTELVRKLMDEAQRTGQTVLSIIGTKNASKPAQQTAQITATAAAIDERLSILGRQLEALLNKLETDTQETNEMLAGFEDRLHAAEERAELALSIARAALDLQTRSVKTADAALNQIISLLKFADPIVKPETEK